MPEITLSWDSRGLDVFRSRAVERALTRALTRAGGEAVRAMKVAASRSVRQRKRFKVKRVNEALPLFFPRGKQEINDLVWRMGVSSKLVPIVEFPHSQTRRGVSVGVNAGKRTLIKGAFIARMKSGHVGVFRRAFKGAPRLPIKEAFTTRVSDVFEDNGMVPAVYARTQSVFQRAFDRLLKLELTKLK